ncbi:MAG: TIGR04282 family arsenosugar biosynthesis glycosyltransferase [Spirochaetota bacterium]|nr:TIGR04282 family arsenosugar biosynthesis glycosyltransferase [Spirochaetota bacterium]
MKKDEALILFVKSPIMGKVKTRLQPEMSMEDSLSLYSAMLKDLIVSLNVLSSIEIFIFYWPHDGLKEIENLLGIFLKYIPQEGKDLGERMHRAFLWAFSKGFSRAVIIGSDIPTLKPSNITDAFRSLNHSDVVLGPSIDGGYYLIGLKKPYPEIFRDIPWSTDVVLKNTLHKVDKMSLTASQLSPKRDIDTFSDVVDLWQHMRDSKTKMNNLLLPNTSRILDNIFSDE